MTAVGLILLGGTAAVTALAQSAMKLVINGNPVTTDARKIGGRTYVPIEDVAKALNMQVFTTGGQIVLRPGGGANQIANQHVAKIGEELFTGKYRFQVNSIQELPKYQMKYANHFTYNKTVEAGEGEKLVVLDCCLKNGTAQKDEFVFSPTEWGENTALTDADEGAHQATAFDVAADEDAPMGAYALPGAAVRFAIVFKVPQNTKPQDLVFTIVRYAQRGSKKGTDVRVALAQ